VGEWIWGPTTNRSVSELDPIRSTNSLISYPIRHSNHVQTNRYREDRIWKCIINNQSLLLDVKIENPKRWKSGTLSLIVYTLVENGSKLILLPSTIEANWPILYGHLRPDFLIHNRIRTIHIKMICRHCRARWNVDSNILIRAMSSKLINRDRNQTDIVYQMPGLDQRNAFRQPNNL
jgi:hypothetical protein